MHSVTRKVIVMVILFFGIIVGAYLYQKHQSQQRLVDPARAQLKSLFAVWSKAGRPEGQALDQLMKQAPPDILVSNFSLTLNGTNYETQFAARRPGIRGTLFITTNHVLILIEDKGAPTVIQDP